MKCQSYINGPLPFTVPSGLFGAALLRCRRSFTASSSKKQDSNRDQRPHKVDKIYDAKEFEDEASQVVDD